GPPLPSRALRTLATFYLYRGEFDKAGAIGRELLDLAEQQGDTGLQGEGHLVGGWSIAFRGDVSTGLDHLERAIALFDPHRHQPGPLRLGPSSGVSSHTTSALLLWLLGSPDRATERAARAVELAEQLNHPFTLAYTGFHAGLLDLWRREFELVQARGSGVLEVAEEHDYPIWRALGLALEGVAMTGLGRAEEGLARLDRGIALYQGLKTPPVFWPLLLSIKAGALALSGRPAGGPGLVGGGVGGAGGRAGVG